MILHKLVPLFALGLNLLLLGTALASDRKSPRIRLFAYLVSALAVWNLGVLGLRWTDEPGVALAWERFLHLGVIPIPVLFYHYVLVFLDVGWRRPSLILGYCLCALFFAVSATAAFMSGVSDTYWGFAPAAGPLYAPFFAYFQAYLVIGLVWLIRGYRAIGSSFRRNRTLLVICGVLVSLLGGVVDFARFIFGWERLYPVGIPSNVVFALALGVAIVRYRLVDIGGLAKRSLLYLLTSLAIAPILVAGLYVVDLVAPDRLVPEPSGTDLRYPLILLLAFGAALPFLRKLEGALDRLMFQRQHGVKDALVALSRNMVSVLDIDTLGQSLTEGLVGRIPVMHASLQLYDRATGCFSPLAPAISGAVESNVLTQPLDNKLGLWLRVSGRTLVVEEGVLRAVSDARARAVMNELEAAQVALLVPSLSDGELTAVLVLGEKLSGEIFDPSEIELLETLMGQVAIALRNSRLYQDLRNQMDELQRTQEQLVQSAKLAAVGELAATVAHEINNPLMVILGSSELLMQRTPGDAHARAKLSLIAGEAGRAAGIMRNLLDFARRREPKREPVRLQELVGRALDLLQVKLVRTRVEIRTAFDQAVPTILGDPDQLVQVLINLIANAIDAMPDGGRLVLKSAISGDEDRPGVELTVSDTGLGMAPDQLARIFEPFYTTKPEGRGTGLGLSVSLGIVRKHGGTMEVESEPGTGTTMVVRLPLATASANPRGGVPPVILGVPEGRREPLPADAPSLGSGGPRDHAA